MLPRRVTITLLAIAAPLAATGSASALSVIDTIFVGTSPEAVAFSADGSRAYVTNKSSNSVSVIDTATRTVVHTITGIGYASGISIVGNRAAVTGTTGGPNKVWYLDLTTNSVSHTSPNLTGYAPGIALTPDGTQAWATTSNTVTVLDSVAGVTGATAANFVSYNEIAITPDGTRAWVTSYNGPDVQVFNTSSRALVQTLTVSPGSPIGVAIAPDGTRAFVADCGGTALRSYATSTYAAGPAVTIPGCPVDVAINPAGTLGFVTQLTADTVTAVDLPGNSAIAQVSVGDGPRGAAVSPDGSHLYVVNGNSGSVSVIAAGAPDAPTAPTASAGNAQATVSWTAPSVAGGTPITSYTATAVGNPLLTCTATAPATSCTITGLTNGTPYAFTVTATNGQGTSAASTASAPVTPTAPGGGAAPTANPLTPTAVAGITATLLPSRTRMPAGGAMTLGLRVRNTGAAPAERVTACVRMPAGLVMVRSAGATRSRNTACFALGTVASASIATRAVTVRATAGRSTLRITGWARASNVATSRAPAVSVRITGRAPRPVVTG